MTKNKNRIFLIICISFLIVFVVAVLILKRRLQDNHVVTTGVIKHCYWGGPKTTRYIVEADFSIEGKVYTPTCQLSCTELKLDSLKVRLIGLKVPVVYNPNAPYISVLLLEKSMFTEYKVPIPDTLRWLPDFLECK